MCVWMNVDEQGWTDLNGILNVLGKVSYSGKWNRERTVVLDLYF